MRILLTFGPAWEPLDGARRLTNMSTGRLGVQLANAFTAAGCTVHCLRGEGASYHGPLHARDVETFSTNDDLAAKLERLSRQYRLDAVFHAAALCDYRVARITNAAGDVLRSQKLATRDGRLVLELEPATKVLPQLRTWFPQARIVGWKYELAGSRDEAFAKAWRQLRECHTDACVLNGAAYGEGYAVCEAEGAVQACPDTATLAEALLEWLRPSEPLPASRRSDSRGCADEGNGGRWPHVCSCELCGVLA